MIRLSEIRTIAKRVSRLFNSDKSLLTNWITQNIALIESELDSSISQDELFDNFTDETTRNFQKLFLELKRFIKEHGNINRIAVEEEADGIYIHLNSLGKRTNLLHAKKLRTHFKHIEQWDSMKKGVFFEKFCALFLTDLGLETEVTETSGDKGIDIIAQYKSKLDEELGQLVFDDFVYLLAQVKFLNRKADTPILRKLLGDSILLRFDRLEYVQIAHNAFHLLVFSHCGFTEEAIQFAKLNKIMIINTEQIISIISGSNNASDWNCFKYIESVINN